MSEIQRRSVPSLLGRFWRYLDYLAHIGASQTLGRISKPRDPMGPRLLPDYPYIEDGSRSHLLDIWLPTPHQGRSPVVLYIHGGGFTFGSKDTHQIAGHKFAQRGFLTFVINYRLAPQHPYPASIEDCCHALCWVWDHLEHFGGDPERLAVAGESAGGNLTAMLAILNSYKRPETFSQDVWARKISLRAAIPFCGWHDPGDWTKRYREHPILGRISPVIRLFSSSLLGRSHREWEERAPLVSPLPFLENEPDRPLPTFLIPVGTRDPLLGDSRRLKKALDKAGARAEIKEYKGAIHAHHLFPYTPGSRRVWRDVEKFLAQPDVLGPRLHAVA